ncbi:hypothetical protein [Methylogaea oryzae]|nr:hypothetical protein [Methylogaea oryzae]
MTTIAAGLINLVLAVGGWYGYRVYKKRVSAKQASLLDDLAPANPKE